MLLQNSWKKFVLNESEKIIKILFSACELRKYINFNKFHGIKKHKIQLLIGYRQKSITKSDLKIDFFWKMLKEGARGLVLYFTSTAEGFHGPPQAFKISLRTDLQNYFKIQIQNYSRHQKTHFKFYKMHKLINST